MDTHEVSNGGTGTRVQSHRLSDRRSTDFGLGEVERLDVREGKGDVGVSPLESVTSSLGSGGGVALCDPTELIRGLLGCGLSAGDAAGVAKSYYDAASRVGENQESSVATRSVTSSRALRSAKWRQTMSTMPYVEGQCYLHVIRWGRRNAYQRALGLSPPVRAFVAMLEPGDLDEDTAKAFGLYRVSAVAYGREVEYHIADQCSEGVYIGTVWDCVASIISLYPTVNSVFTCPSFVGIDMPLVGVLGGIGHSAVALTASSPVDTVDVEASVDQRGDVVPLFDGAANSISGFVASLDKLLLCDGSVDLPVVFAPRYQTGSLARSASRYHVFSSSEPTVVVLQLGVGAAYLGPVGIDMCGFSFGCEYVMLVVPAGVLVTLRPPSDGDPCTAFRHTLNAAEFASVCLAHTGLQLVSHLTVLNYAMAQRSILVGRGPHVYEGDNENVPGKIPSIFKCFGGRATIECDVSSSLGALIVPQNHEVTVIDQMCTAADIVPFGNVCRVSLRY